MVYKDYSLAQQHCAIIKFEKPRRYFFVLKRWGVIVKKRVLLLCLCWLLLGVSQAGAAALNGYTAEEWLAIAEQHILRQQYNRALNAATNAISLDPASDTAYFLRGVSYANLSFAHQATLELNDAIKLNPDKVIYYIWRAELLSSRFIFEDAKADLDTAVRLNPRSTIVYQKRGQILQKMNDHWAAIADFDRAIELNPQDYRSYFQKAGSCDALGLKQQALDNYQTFLSLAPERLKKEYREAAEARVKALTS
jgi:tetratricopeptide (TPR) repeat protein